MKRNNTKPTRMITFELTGPPFPNNPHLDLTVSTCHAHLQQQKGNELKATQNQQCTAKKNFVTCTSSRTNDNIQFLS
jgi:hypothetical protein